MTRRATLGAAVSLAAGVLAGCSKVLDAPSSTSAYGVVGGAGAVAGETERGHAPAGWLLDRRRKSCVG